MSSYTDDERRASGASAEAGPSSSLRRSSRNRAPRQLYEPEQDSSKTKLVPLPLPPAFGTAQVLGQSARAAGAPRSEGGERGDLFHARINSRSGGGAAGAGPEPAQQPRVVVARLDGWTCGCPH
jgi:hypothetical protein